MNKLSRRGILQSLLAVATLPLAKFMKAEEKAITIKNPCLEEYVGCNGFGKKHASIIRRFSLAEGSLARSPRFNRDCMLAGPLTRASASWAVTEGEEVLIPIYEIAVNRPDSYSKESNLLVLQEMEDERVNKLQEDFVAHFGYSPVTIEVYVRPVEHLQYDYPHRTMHFITFRKIGMVAYGDRKC